MPWQKGTLAIKGKGAGAHAPTAHPSACACWLVMYIEVSVIWRCEDIHWQVLPVMYKNVEVWYVGRLLEFAGPRWRLYSGPCLQLFNLYIRSIYLFVLFTQCLRFFKFVGVRIIKCKITLHSLHHKNLIYSQTKMYSDTFNISHSLFAIV